MPIHQPTELNTIRTFADLIHYLRDEMGWPVAADDFDELTFEYAPQELGINERDAANIKEIRRLRPLEPPQPWGVLFVRFANKRLSVAALRSILRGFVRRQRLQGSASDRKTWDLQDLLFIC